MPKNNSKDKNKTPQDKYKMSAFTAADDIKYRKYKNRMVAMGEKPLSKREWYKKNKGD